MLRPRIIPCLLIKNGGLVKTVNFKNEKYVGDPINVVKILNEKEVDELIILDISCTKEKRDINFKLLENIASECRMPLCYGGGVNNISQVNKLVNMGVEKIAINSSLFTDIEFVKQCVNIVGTQSIVAILDVRKKNGKYFIYTHNGTSNTNLDLFEYSVIISKLGIGELVVNSIDLDGTLLGYDFEIVDKIKKVLNIPFTVLGGASSHDNIKELFQKHGNVGAGVGSLFVFKGIYKAVLVNYPTLEEKFKIYPQ
jgi:cyclase